MPNYGDKDYWDQRYKKQQGTTFDWLEDYENVRGLMEKYVKKTDKILMLGCGNAGLLKRNFGNNVQRRLQKYS